MISDSTDYNHDSDCSDAVSVAVYLSNINGMISDSADCNHDSNDSNDVNVAIFLAVFWQ